MKLLSDEILKNIGLVSVISIATIIVLLIVALVFA